jgi:hypothetical protein
MKNGVMPLLLIEDVPERWHNHLSDEFSYEKQHKETSRPKTEMKTISFHDYQALFEPIFDLEQRNSQINNSLQDTLLRVSEIRGKRVGEKEPIMDPLVSNQPGRRKTKMSKNSPLSSVNKHQNTGDK